jgi:large subunit ribosomal protein L4
MTAKPSTDEKTTVIEPLEANKAEKAVEATEAAKATKAAAGKADKAEKAAAPAKAKAEKPAKAAGDKAAASAKADKAKAEDKTEDKPAAEKKAAAKASDKPAVEKPAAKSVDKPAEKSEAAAKSKSAEKAEKLDKKSLTIKNIQGEKVGTAKLPESIFAIAPNIHVLHEVCRAQMAARRSGTHDTKTRGQVSGGGKKPFRQKGTGRARQGTIRAPHYKGGGAVFGPHPRNYAFKVNGKEVKLAMRSALSAKQAEGVLHIVDSLDFEKPSTKEAIKVLECLDISGRVTLVLTDQDINAFLSFRNIPRVRVLDVADANTYDFIDNKALVLTQDALKRIEEVLQ